MSKSVLLLQTLDILRTRPGITMSELAAELGRSQRTIYRYLADLTSELDVRIHCENGVYALAESRDLTAFFGLSSDEAAAVRVALSSTAASESSPFASAAHSALKKIESTLPGLTLAPARDPELDRSQEGSWETSEEVEESAIRINFSAQAAPTIKEMPYHPFQNIEELSDGGVILTISAAATEEMVGWILSFGGEAEALAPQELRCRLGHAARRILCLYEPQAASSLLSEETTADDRCGRCN